MCFLRQAACGFGNRENQFVFDHGNAGGVTSLADSGGILAHAAEVVPKKSDAFFATHGDPP